MRSSYQNTHTPHNLFLVSSLGFVVSLGGITLICVLGGLGLVSLAVSGVLSVSYVALTTMLKYWSVPK